MEGKGEGGRWKGKREREVQCTHACVHLYLYVVKLCGGSMHVVA